MKVNPSIIENPKLLAAIEAVVKDDNIDTRDRLYAALLDATFLVPTPELPLQWCTPGDHVVDGKTGFKIVTVNKVRWETSYPDIQR
jgi:hypothetical protein